MQTNNPTKPTTVKKLLRDAEYFGSGWHYAFEAATDDDQLTYALDEKTIRGIKQRFPNTSGYNTFIYEEKDGRIAHLWGMYEHAHSNKAVAHIVF